MKSSDILSEIKQITWLAGCVTGWGNGYVKLPKGHPWYGKDYDDIKVSVHGGLTYSRQEGKYWVIGFDCAHFNDTPATCPKEYVEKETESLRKKAVAAMKRKSVVQ